MNKTKGSGISRRLSRRILGLLLSVVLILGMMPNTTFSVYAEEADTYNMETTEELSTGTDATPVVETTSDEAEAEKTTSEEGTSEETTSEEVDDALEAEGELELDPVAASEYPPEGTPGFCVLSFTEEFLGVGTGNEEVDYDFGASPDFEDTPYWKNDPAHPGKIMPATESDYNLYYNTATKTLYLNGLNLSITGYDNEGPAVWIESEFGLTIIVEADSTIICTSAQAICSGSSITINGDGNLSLVSKKRGIAALDTSWSSVHHEGKGVISLEPARMAWIGEVTGDGPWAKDAFPAEFAQRPLILDGEEHTGFSGFVITQDDFELYGSWQWNGGLVSEPVHVVHGASVQEVIDKLTGVIPVTFAEDGKVTGVDIVPEYLFITSSATNYAYLVQGDEYITSTRDLKGIIFSASSEAQRTNHPNEADGTWTEDSVCEFRGEVKALFQTLVDSYDLVLEGNVNLDEIKYISYLYNGKIYVATENTQLSADKPYSYDLGSFLVAEEDVVEAIEKYNEDLMREGKEPLGNEWSIDILDILNGTFYSEDYYNENNAWDYETYGLAIKNFLPALHINSQCDFIISGNFANAAPSKNGDDINIYFGFLPDTNHKVSFVYPYGDDDAYYDSFSDEEFNGGRKHRLYNNEGALDVNNYLLDYSKEDLTNGTISRGTMTIPVFVVADDGGPASLDLKVLMYEHITEEGSVSGDYPGAVTMDMASIPNGRILENVDITTAQLDVLEAGNAVDIDLSVNELDASAAVNQAAVADIASVVTEGGYADPYYMDLNLSASIQKNGTKLAFANGTTDITLTELEEPVELTVEIPKEMQSTNESREYAIIRRHVTSDGKVQTEILSAKYDANAKSLTFETDKFSTYAIVYKEPSLPVVTPGAGTTTNAGNNTTAPKTGDNAPIAMAVALLFTSMGLMVFVSRKRKMK